MSDKKNICCPQCGKSKTWAYENKYRPFCSERCKLIDLGAWASDEHRIPGEPANPNEEKNSSNE